MGDDARSFDALKLYETERAPNPRRVRIFLAEKAITVPRVQLDLGRMEQRSEAYTRLNPRQRVPTLVLEDGTAIAETIAICRYFEALQPEPNLFGATPKEQGLVEMWQRFVELDLLVPVMHAFRHIHPAMAEREVPQVKEWGEANKPKALAFLAFLNDELAERGYIAGARFTVADITALVCIDFMKVARIDLPEDFAHIRRWHRVVSERPSARA